MKIINRRAFYDYELGEKFEAGINLLGAEVKAVRGGAADLSGSFVRIIGNEAYIINTKIFPYKFARIEQFDPRRTRKLLLHKKQIIAIKSKSEGGGLTVVPVSLYTRGNLIKLELAFAKAKKKFEKKEAIKRKNIEREMEEALKGSF